MSKYGANLPAVLIPVGDICVQITIPAHPDYVKLFVRAIRQLEVNRMYARDEDLSAKIVVAQWRDRTITPLIEALANSNDNCEFYDGTCRSYPPFASFVHYTPQNPYTEPDLIPEGYLVPPFWINGMDNSHDIPTHEHGDVCLDFGSIPIDFVSLPTIDLCVEGSGIAKIHMLSIALGGVAVISVDNPPDIGDILAGIITGDLIIIDLNQDIVSLPPETAIELTPREIEITTEGEHHIYVVFFPIVDDSLVPLRFGGGIRRIELCGGLRPCGEPPPPPPPPLEGVTELKPEFQFTADCGLEYRLLDQEENIVQDWQVVAGWVDNAAACFTALGGTMTPEELTEAICEANRCTIEEMAKRYLSGSTTNIVIDEDGNVVPPSESGESGLPEDDPTTTLIDENLAAKAGGVINTRLMITAITTDMAAWHAAGASAAVAENRLILIYGLPPSSDLTNFVTYWYTILLAPNAAITIQESLDSLFFCKGLTIQTFSYYALKVHTFTGERDALLMLAPNLVPSLLNQWFESGIDTPSTDYFNYSCVRAPNETLLIAAINPNYLTLTQWKVNHRIRITATGAFVDPTGIIRDLWYYKPVAGAVQNAFASTTFTAGSVLAEPTTTENPYNPAHVYVFTMETLFTSALQIQVLPHGVFGGGGTGDISLLIEDLGEIGV